MALILDSKKVVVDGAHVFVGGHPLDALIDTVQIVIIADYEHGTYRVLKNQIILSKNVREFAFPIPELPEFLTTMHYISRDE